jgi:hypothetical protein
MMAKKQSRTYGKENQFTYYIAINTWYHQVASFDEWAAQSLLRAIRNNGLIATIKCCDDAALTLVSGEGEMSGIGELLATMPLHRYSYFGVNQSKNFLQEELPTRLQLLRYLKRFSPLGAESVTNDSIAKFLSCENSNKLSQRVEYPRWLIHAVRTEIQSVVDWKSVMHEISQMSVYDFDVPSGTTYEGYHTLAQKVDAIFGQYPEMAYQPFGLPYVFPYYKQSSDEDTARVQAVPKSYKAARIIAMEPVVRQAISHNVMRIIARHLPRCIDVTDQTRNQELAKVGSETGGIATLDASNASDLITKTLFREVFPEEVVQVLDPLFSHYTIIDGKRRAMQMMSTAGHSLTFVLETIVYYGIAAAACSYVETFGTEEALIASAYGDDVAISSVAAETAMDFYSLLGLKINKTKSYVSGPYRESCGEEYFSGLNVSTTYYPRFPVIGKFTKNGITLGKAMYKDTYRGKVDDSTTMLVDLQKRLFGVSYNASLFLWEVVVTARPNITSSKFGEVCNDLWAATDLGVPYNTTNRIEEGHVPDPVVVPLCSVSRHCYPAIRFEADNMDIIRYSKRNFDIFKYQEFLKHGPSFSDPLLELLGVSDSPMTIQAYCGKGKLVWQFSY